MSRRIAIGCGGTAGHVYPALAIADAWRRAAPDVEVLFLGTGDGFETRLVPEHGHRLAVVRAAPFLRTGVAGRLRAPVVTLLGAAEARPILRRERIELVLGLGNYACAPAMLAGWSLGLPTVLHEANAVAGLANRLLGRAADHVLLGFASAGAAFARPTTVTGTPVRAGIVALAGARRAPARGAPFRVLVSGGSRGAPFLDRRVPDLLARLAAEAHALDVRHQVGEGAIETVRAAYAAAGIAAAVVAYIDDMAAAYAWADCAVISAGAGTLAEIAALGLPALVVPLGSAALDHQTANARLFAEASGACWTREEEWDAEKLAAYVRSLIVSPAAWSAASAGVRRLAAPDAGAAVVRACEAVLAAKAHGSGAPRRAR